MLALLICFFCLKDVKDTHHFGWAFFSIQNNKSTQNSYSAHYFLLQVLFASLLRLKHHLCDFTKFNARAILMDIVKSTDDKSTVNLNTDHEWP
jgi:hypothetical protein